MIMVKNYNPVIVFAFSKRECEALALTMSKLEFNSTEEQDLITNIFNNAMENLSPDDRQLPQISNLLPLLKRGIGIHHGGLLPILKEVIEILFQEGFIKVLFATETFSIGLNMPAKTVVFVAARKFDGHDFRNLSSGEYIQMSGRAGRRGLDDRGVVIMMCDEKLEPTAAKDMIKGEADRLDSAFHLGYNMVLNLMKVEGISPEFMLERCFYQFQNNAEVPVIEAGTSVRYVCCEGCDLTYVGGCRAREGGTEEGGDYSARRGACRELLRPPSAARPDEWGLPGSHYASQLCPSLPSAGSSRQGEVSTVGFRLGCHRQLPEAVATKGISAS